MAIEDAFVLGRELRGVGHDREQVLPTLTLILALALTLTLTPTLTTALTYSLTVLTYSLTSLSSSTFLLLATY